MNTAPPQELEKTPSKGLRRVVWLILATSLLVVFLQIMQVRSKTGEVPFLSANDRSRWANVASLVDYRTFTIDAFQTYRDPETNRRTWQSIDRVEHRDRSGQLHQYSSKPPLLATLVAVLYAILKSITGWGIQQHTFLVARTLLVLVNLPLLALMQWAVMDVVLRHATKRATGIFMAVAVGFGTLLTPFAISLNNHLPAAASVAVALCLFDRQAFLGVTWRRMFFAGIAVAMAFVNELPALSIVALWTAVALWMQPRLAITAYAPGFAIVAFAFFGTNFVAHNSWRPPYAHRGVGPTIATIPWEGDLELTKPRIAETLQERLEDLQFLPSRTRGRVRVDAPTRTIALDFTADSVRIAQWDDWYDYPGTYWSDERRTGIDRGEASRLRYAWHVLLGHHGVFSLTPIWLLSLVGSFLWLSHLRVPKDEAVSPHTRHAIHYPIFRTHTSFTAAATIAITLVCLAFYLARPLIDRNYGGVSVGFRWLLWLIPMWLFLAIPAIDRCWEKRWSKGVLIVLMAASFFTVTQSLSNPWTHPWIYSLLNP